MENKENDLILNMLANPQFNLMDFQSVGLNRDNTALLPEERYKASEKIITNQNFLDENGNFNEAKFHNFYISAGQFYNQLASQDYEKSILDNAKFSKDNIWVSPEKRVIDYTPKLVRKQNETLVSNSLDAIGKKGNPILSTSEIAQTQKIYNPSTKEWSDSPNDSFFSNMFNTLVLASYDEDELDPITGEKIHSKGELKYNEEGLPYYEYLNGRDVYGKQVLNKMNLLTTDGSFANKFDFFDSDDIEQKSIGGTILKNAALVGSMFIPYVGPVITGLSVATQTTGLLASLGKLALGNDNEFLNNIQGWTKSVNRQASTEYAQTHTWCGENLLNMIGDTIGQLSEQRWIFKAAPTLLRGDTKIWKALSSEKGRNQVIQETEKALSTANESKKVQDILDLIETPDGVFKVQKYNEQMALLIRNKAVKTVDELIKQGQKISSPLSKAYMTGITVQDTYGEAKQAGASDKEAALLTIGYATMEAMLLNTGVGEWILPELRGDKFRFKAIQEALSKDIKDAYNKYTQNQSKQSFIKNVINIGKKIAKNDYAEFASGKGIKTGLNVIGAHAAGESFEEVSEEVLADVSKSIFNVIRWLRGENSLELGEWENVGDRYLMSALGGFVGGGITSASTDFNVARKLSTMDKSQAIQELLYIVNNNDDGKFLKSLEYVELGNKNLSASELINDDTNNPIWAQAKENDNQDLAIKDGIKKEIKLIKDILNSEGAKISTDSLLNKLTFEDRTDLIKNLRFQNLQNTQSIGTYLQDFQNLQSDLIRIKSSLFTLEHSTKDTEKNSELIEDQKKQLNKELSEKRKELQAYKNGDFAPQAIRDTIFEMNPLINNFLVKTNLVLYAESKYHKKWEDLSKEEIKEVTELYKNYSETDMKDDVRTRSEIFHNMMELATPTILNSKKILEQSQKNEFSELQDLEYFTNKYLKALIPQNIENDNFDTEAYLNLIKNQTDSKGILGIQYTLAKFLSDEKKSELNDLETQINQTTDEFYKNSLSNLYQQKLFYGTVDYVDNLVSQYLKIGYINPESKRSLIKIINEYKQVISTIQRSLGYPDFKLVQLNKKLTKQQKLIKELNHTPIIDYLNQFKLSTTNSNLNLLNHWDQTIKLLQDNSEDFSEFRIDQVWEDNNEEALLLLDAYIAVINGVKIDNADINNPNGYSKILNEVYQAQGIKNYTPLAELDSQTANLLIQDATKIKNRLLFAKQLNSLNKGQKLKQQKKVAINKDYLIFKKIERLIQVIPDDWIGKEDLIKVVNEADTLKQYSESRDLKINKDDSIEIEREMLNIEDALYTFFSKSKNSEGTINKDKLIILLRKFAGEGGFFQKTNSLLTEESEDIDDNSFIWWLAARAAVKAKDFQSVYLKSLSENIAPIASQELAVYLGIAAITNSNMLNSFVDAYRDTIIQDFNSFDENKRKILLNNFDQSGDAYSKDLLKYFGGHDVVPKYKNMIFIEGAPGTGKSKGVFKTIKLIMDHINPDILNNAIYVHATEDSAKEASEFIGINGKSFNRVNFLKWVSGEWKDINLNNNELYKDSYVIDKDGTITNNWKLNKYTDVPKVIFIDEVTHYNEQEISMIEQFALENGIIIITAGDFEQDTQTAYLKLPDFKPLVTATLNRNKFIRTPKQGVSLRTACKQMTISVNKLQAGINDFIKNKNVDIQFNYLDSDKNHKGLYGVKSFQTSNSQLTQEEVDELLPTIQLMVDTLKPEHKIGEKIIPSEKIGYIYHDENSLLYKAIKEKFSDKINFFKDSDAQGLEGQYYIVENNREFANKQSSKSQQLNYLRQLYTGVTRAEQGALVITPESFGNVNFSLDYEDKNFQLESLNPNDIKKASINRKLLLSELLENYNENKIEIHSPKIIKKEDVVDLPHKKTYLPPLINIPSIPERIDTGYTNQSKAEERINLLKTKVSQLGSVEIIDSKGNIYELRDIVIETQTKNKIQIYYPTLLFADSNGKMYKLSEDDFNKEFKIVSKQNKDELPIFNVGEKLVLQNQAPIEIIEITSTDPITYRIRDLDGKNERLITQQELQNIFKEKYVDESDEKPEYFPDNDFENDYDSYVESLEEVNQDEETSQTIKGNNIHINHIVYTHNMFEMGVDEQSDGSAVYNGPKEIFDSRIDSAIGLMHLLGNNVPYKQLENIIAMLSNEVSNNANNSDLLSKFKTILGLNGDVSMNYYIKSSAGTFNSSDPKYYRYYLDRNTEHLKYIHSDNQEAAEQPMRKKIILVIFENGLPKFELPVGSLNSPLTLLTLKNDEGEFIFQDVLDFFNAQSLNFSQDDIALDAQSYNQKTNLYQIINNIITKFDNTEYQELVDLFKLWQFTSNGVFLLPQDFNLASNTSTGPQLIKRRGNKQLDNNLQYTSKIENIEEFVKNPKFHVSSIFASKKGLVGNKQISGLNPGHSFVLISNSNEFYDDNTLVEQFEKQLSDPNEPIKVKLCYVIPPSATISDWLINKHNMYLNASTSQQHEIYDIGNDFTAYRVLQALIESGDFNNLKSSDNTQEEVKKAIEELNQIENKWNSDDIQFNNTLINGVSEKDIFENLKNEIGEKYARRNMRIQEQKRLLYSVPSWKVTNLQYKQLKDLLTSYVTNIVWFNYPGVEILPNQAKHYITKIDYRPENLKIIQDACLNASNHIGKICYKPQYSKNEIGSFIKIKVQDKFSLGNTPSGTSAKFQIHVGIQPPSFSIDNFSEIIHNLVNQFYYAKDHTWKLKSSAQEAQNDYLKSENDPKTQNIKTEILKEYSKYFKNHYLNENILNQEFDSKHQLLIALVNDYNSNYGNYGFIYNNQIILTKLENSDVRVVKPINELNNLHPFKLELQDKLGNQTFIDIFFDVDQNQIKFIKGRKTNLKLIQINQASNLDLSNEDIDLIKNSKNKLPIIMKSKINSLLPDNLTNSQDYMEHLDNLKLLFNNISNDIESNFKFLISKNPDDSEKLHEIKNKLLNYVNGIGTFNVKTQDIIRIDNRRIQITQINQNEIMGNELNENDEIINSDVILTESEKINMTKEERECSPIKLTII